MSKHKRPPQYVLDNMHLNNKEEYKQLKRKEIRAVLAAINDLSAGCLYLPRKLYDEISVLQNAALKIKKGLSCKEWTAKNE